jgi:tetratricopeptide (TPR) repeat protein
MAPEAFEGQYDQRSETYCLALTLYELATLQPAFEPSSTPELLKRIMTTAPRSPSKITPQIPRDLNTIIEKALSKSSAERYQSAVAIRDDLLAFLAGRAISARRFSTLENAWRWSKRNPLIASLVTISSGLVLTVAILATWGYFMSVAARDKALEDARMLTIEQEKTEQALALANRTKEQLQQQFDRAEANVAVTVEMFDQMFRKIIFKGTGQHDQDLQLDGFRQLSGIETAVTEADATFLLEMLAFYQKCAEQNLESRQLREQTGRAFRRIANIYHLTGDYGGAQTAYESAQQIFSTLLTEQPESVALAVELVVTRNELANAMELRGDFVGPQFNRVVAHYDHTLEILSSHPRHDASEIQLELARTLNLIAAFVPRRPIDIPPAFRQSNHDVDPTTESARESGESRLNRVRKNKANWIGRAVEISDRLVEQDPANVEFQLVRARSYCQLAEFRFLMRQTEDSREAIDVADKIISQLVSQQPNNSEFQFLQAQILATPIGDGPRAAERLAKAQLITRGLAQKYERNLDYRQLHASTSVQLSRINAQAGDLDSAIANLEIAQVQYTAILEQAPLYLRIRQNHIRGLWQLADFLVQKQQFKKAELMLEDAIRQLRQLIFTYQIRPRAVSQIISRSYEALAHVRRQAGDSTGAVSAKRNAERFDPQNRTRN